MFISAYQEALKDKLAEKRRKRAEWQRKARILRGEPVDEVREAKEVEVKLLSEVLLLGGRRHKTREWVEDNTLPVIEFQNHDDGTIDRYRMRGRNKRGVPVYQLIEEEPNDTGDGGSEEGVSVPGDGAGADADGSEDDDLGSDEPVKLGSAG